jgi:RNA polymerase sigma factor (TIGR02999 family)
MARQPSDQTLQTTILVHEAWLRMSSAPGKWRDEGHFFAAASVTMRHVLIDYARRKSRQRRGGKMHHLSLADISELEAPGRTDMVILIDEAISELEKLNPERAQVVIDRFFGGLTNQEIAQRLGIGERTVERHWAVAKVWLLRWIQNETRSCAQAVA